MPKKPYIKILKGIAALALILIGAEVFLRMFIGLGKPPLMMADRDVGYYYKANQDLRRFGNTIRYNEYHQRSESLMEKPTYRILAIGDSVLNGGSLIDQKDTITEILERKLNRYSAVNGEVLNASAKSWGPENEYEYIKKFGIFNASLVIIQIGTNDLTQAKARGGMVGRSTHPSRNPRSAVWEMIFRYVRPRVFGKFLKKPGTPRNDQNADEQLLENLKAIQKIATITKEANAPLIVLFVPERGELNKKNKKTGKKSFKKILDEQDIFYIDLLERSPGLRKGYFIDGIHLNKKGNYFVAAVLLEYVNKKVILNKKGNE